eukprot:SM000219S06687  [mRNA]  locus=s219:149011:149865:+ [translate_table: standard]
MRPCPSGINPNCVSTSSNNDAYAFPWEVLDGGDVPATTQKLESAILATQKNAAIVQSEATDRGHYVCAEVDGLLGRDTVEFLVRPGRVTYRAMAGRVVYVYPFTTPLGDFGAQRRHLRQLEDELGWGHPEYTSTDAGSY